MRIGMWVVPGLVVLTYAYLGLLIIWAVLHVVFGDQWWWLFLLNAVMFYAFLPLPLVPLVALFGRRQELWFGFGVALIVWGNLYGGMFLPASTMTSDPNAPTLSVMTYNMLRHNHDPEPLIDALRTADADVVAIQELNVEIADAIERELHAEYPYQVLRPEVARAGMGVISRYPLHDTGRTLPGAWIGTPQILKLEFQDTTVVLFNVHARSTSMGFGGNVRFAPTQMEATIREREQEMETLVAEVQAIGEPVLVVGDFNTVDVSTAYNIVTHELHDAWREAGAGLGNTFPGAATPGSSRPMVAGIPIPKWLVRIDYIFYSADWRTVAAELGPWDGVSDHRPVMARLRLVQ